MTIVASGILYYCSSTKRVLLGKRSNDSDGGAGEWAAFGGKLEENETLVECAIREVEEETGYQEKEPEKLRLNYRSEWSHAHARVHFYLFMKLVPKEFELPNLDKKESSTYGWFPVDELPTPLLEPFKVNFNKGALSRLK